MRRLLSYLAELKWWIVWSLLLGAVSQVFFMFEPHFLGILVDKFASHPHEAGYYNDKADYVIEGTRTQPAFVAGVLKYLILILSVNIVANLAKTVQDYFVKAVTEKCGNRLYTDGLQHCMSLPYEKFEGRRSGETLSILHNARINVQQFLTPVMYVLFSTLVAVIFVFIYSFSIHWSLAIIYFIAIIILIFVSSLLTVKLKDIEQRIMTEINSMAGSTVESLRNMQLVKSLGLTDNQFKKHSSNVYSILGLQLNLRKYIRFITLMNGVFINFLRISIILVLLFFIFRDELTTGKLIALSFYSVFILAPFHELGNIVLYYRAAQASLVDFNNLMNHPPEPKSVSPVKIDRITQLEFQDVHYKHQTAVYSAINGISFKISAGQTVAFAGPSGSGKTTIVKLLLGLYQPQSGRILYNGTGIGEIDLDLLRSQIGLVTQDTQLFAGSIKENLLFVNPAASDEQIQTAILKAGGSNIMERCNSGIDTLIGEGGIKLSGGEKQRLAIARALLRDPQIMIFDEATSSLDSIKEEEVMSDIRSVSSQGDTISILIAHRLSTILHADMIYVMENGSIVETGVHENLLALKGLYYAMWRQQIGERKTVEAHKLFPYHT